jgi:hypothetical protein
MTIMNLETIKIFEKICKIPCKTDHRKKGNMKIAEVLVVMGPLRATGQNLSERGSFLLRSAKIFRIYIKLSYIKFFGKEKN